MAALRSLFARSTGSLGMIGPLVANPGCSVSSQDLSLQTVDLLGARNLLIHNSIKHDPSLVVPEQTEELPSTSYVRGAAELPGVSSTKEVDALCLNLDGVVVPSPVYVNGWGPKLCGLSCAVRGDSFWLDQFSDCEVRKMLKKLEPAYLQKVYALKTKEQEFEALEKLYAVTRTELKQSQFELYNAQFLYQQKLYAFNTKSENLKAKEQAVESQEVRNAVISRDLKQLQLEMHQRDLAYGRQLARDCMVEQVLGKLNALCDAVERQEPAVTVCKFVEKVEEDSVSMKRRELSLMSKSSTKLSSKVYYICMSKFFPDGFSGSMLRFLGRFGRFLVFINTTYKFLASYAIMVGGGYVWYHTAMNKEDISDYIDKKLTDMQATLLKELEDHRAQKGKKELEEVPRKATDPDDAEDIRDFIVQKLTDMHATLLKQLEDHLAQKDKKELEEVPRKATDPDDAEDIRDFIVQKLTDMHATLLKQLEDHLAQKGEKELEGQVPRKARVADDLGKVKARVADDLGKVKKSEDAE